MNSGEHIGLTLYQYSNGCLENDDVGNSIVITDDVDSDAWEVLLSRVTADGDMLANEGASHVGFMATLDEYAIGRKMRNVAIIYGCSYWIDYRNATSPKIWVQHEVFECDVLVR